MTVKKGIPWGPFTLRIPFVHFTISWSEYIQGVTAGSAAALIFLPMLINWFGLTQYNMNNIHKCIGSYYNAIYLYHIYIKNYLD